MGSYECNFRNAHPIYKGYTLETLLDDLQSLGYNVYFSDMLTTLHTTRHKIHGVFVVVLKEGATTFHLLNGTYNYLCALEGRDSVPVHIEAQYTPALQSDERWSLWTNPMRNRREEAWNMMWKNCKTFKSESDLKEYILIHMKNWDDVGNTLWYARRPKVVNK